jgi:small-conductance mechanosensitive channel
MIRPWLLFFALTASCIPVRGQDELLAVRVDGRVIFEVGMAGSTSAVERVRSIDRRIDRLLENPQAIVQATIQPSLTNATERVITVSGTPVVTVTEADAQDHLTSVEDLARQWATALDLALERGKERRLSPGARFRTEVQSSVQTALARLLESAVTVVPRALAALVVLGLFWALAASLRWVMRMVFCRIVSDRTVENLIRQVAYYSTWALGLVVAADALGFDAETVITGLGLTSLALGFALKDILSNFVSGLLILLLRPFELGDQIVVGETEGAVERIELRATHIRTYDGRAVVVPNAEVFTSRIINNTEAPLRRGSVSLFLAYDQDLRRAVEVVGIAVPPVEGVISKPAPSVRVRDLGADDITIEARFWTDSRRSDFLATMSAVREAIVTALKQAGVGLPNPDVRILKRR